jgi:hypothetical protein
MTAPVEEETLLLPDLGEPTHIVCCEDITATFCGETVDDDEIECMDEVAITCAPCIEVEAKQGLAACPSFLICAHVHCEPNRCHVRE